MIGMDASTGKPLGGEDHLRQSVTDILSTPLGARVARREYGSLLPELLDQPMNALGRMRLIAATALALARWEPRLRVTAVAVQPAATGAVTLTIDAARTDGPAPNARTRLLVPLARSA
ncbi:GPW/gp25 family protein [Sphingomonas sp. NPDC079357]|uniref:GPW/gp25 family protein n=1 Tax=Sphingomonas sp. NPDC079357 TaxID=3364518 RepID=UPI00384CF1E0